MRFIGDIHGELFHYMNVIEDCNESVQVGDFGVGFLTEYDFMDSIHEDGQHKFIRGNHDDPFLCKERVGYIEDGTYDAERDIFYVGGAWSIDWKYRTPGYTWWPEEELSDEELSHMHDLYVKYKPRIMVTHDCPTGVAFQLFIEGTSRYHYKSRTSETFEAMFAEHQPELWLFGHWHIARDQCINGTRFICLGINNYIDLEV